MGRTTRQKDAIKFVLNRAGRPLSVREVFESARGVSAGLGIATVYRNLKTLESEKKVLRVELPGEAPRWEAAPEAHHHHFLCRSCDRLFEINGCPEDIKMILPQGYTMEEHDILLRGICNKCNKAKQKAK